MNRFVSACHPFAILLTSTSVAAPERNSTVADRRLVNVTVYNGGMALIHDRRTIRVNRGLNRIAWRDVSANMDATSALLRSVDSPDGITVLEQNFNYDVLNPSELLQKYVGREVTVVHDRPALGEPLRETARILSTDGGIVLRYGNRIETALRGHIVFPALPENFRDRPTLVLDVDSRQSGMQTLDLSYLSSGLSWYADYVGALSPDESHMSLNGLITLSNTSGASYENAHLQLVAGNVNVVQPRMGQEQLLTIAHVTSRNARQENYFEYHLYTLERPTTILDRQTKQLSLLSARDVPVRKTLEVRGSTYYYQNRQPDLGDRLPVGVYVSFTNRGGELGVPLPAGAVRLYKNDAQGLSQFLGSDTIAHTPANETVRLHVGDSFDVTARKKQTGFSAPNGCSAESSYEIAISNAKSIPQDVLVVEPIPGEWQILSENLSHAKSSASTATWTVSVQPSGRSLLTYRVRSRWC